MQIVEVCQQNIVIIIVVIIDAKLIRYHEKSNKEKNSFEEPCAS